MDDVRAGAYISRGGHNSSRLVETLLGACNQVSVPRGLKEAEDLPPAPKLERRKKRGTAGLGWAETGYKAGLSALSHSSCP